MDNIFVMIAEYPFWGAAPKKTVRRFTFIVTLVAAEVQILQKKVKPP
jgi:hypothetical protein